MDTTNPHLRAISRQAESNLHTERKDRRVVARAARVERRARIAELRVAESITELVAA